MTLDNNIPESATATAASDVIEVPTNANSDSESGSDEALLSDGINDTHSTNSMIETVTVLSSLNSSDSQSESEPSSYVCDVEPADMKPNRKLDIEGSNPLGLPYEKWSDWNWAVENGENCVGWMTDEEIDERDRFLNRSEYVEEIDRPTRTLDFLEIGTSTYNTISHAVFPLPNGRFSDCSTEVYHSYRPRFKNLDDPTLGMAVDVVPWVLEHLPQGEEGKLLKVNIALLGPESVSEITDWRRLSDAQKVESVHQYKDMRSTINKIRDEHKIGDDTIEGRRLYGAEQILVRGSNSVGETGTLTATTDSDHNSNHLKINLTNNTLQAAATSSESVADSTVAPSISIGTNSDDQEATSFGDNSPSVSRDTENLQESPRKRQRTSAVSEEDVSENTEVKDNLSESPSELSQSCSDAEFQNSLSRDEWQIWREYRSRTWTQWASELGGSTSSYRYNNKKKSDYTDEENQLWDEMEAESWLKFRKIIERVRALKMNQTQSPHNDNQAGLTLFLSNHNDDLSPISRQILSNCINDSNHNENSTSSYSPSNSDNYMEDSDLSESPRSLQSDSAKTLVPRQADEERATWKEQNNFSEGDWVEWDEKMKKSTHETGLTSNYNDLVNDARFFGFFQKMGWDKADATLYYISQKKIQDLESPYINNHRCEDHKKYRCFSCYHTGQLASACTSVNQQPSYFKNRLESVGLSHYQEERKVRSMNYNQLLEFYDVLRPRLLQLDCEGKDFAILRGLIEHVYKYGPAARPEMIVFEGCSGKKYLPECIETIRELFKIGYVLEYNPFTPENFKIQDARVINVAMVIMDPDYHSNTTPSHEKKDNMKI